MTAIKHPLGQAIAETAGMAGECGLFGVLQVYGANGLKAEFPESICYGFQKGLIVKQIDTAFRRRGYNHMGGGNGFIGAFASDTTICV